MHIKRSTTQSLQEASMSKVIRKRSPVTLTRTESRSRNFHQSDVRQCLRYIVSQILVDSNGKRWPSGIRFNVKICKFISLALQRTLIKLRLFNLIYGGVRCFGVCLFAYLFIRKIRNKFSTLHDIRLQVHCTYLVCYTPLSTALWRSRTRLEIKHFPSCRTRS